MKKQIDAVIEEVKNVLGDRYDINTPSADLLTKDEIVTVQTNILSGLADGSIAYKGDVSNEKTLRQYSKNLVKNHLTKSKKLNGNNVYKSTPIKDEQLVELNKVLKNYAKDTTEYVEVQKAITTRKKELNNQKTTQHGVDTSLLPTGLKDSLDI